MYHSFLIHMSAYGYLGCLYALAIINSAAMNIAKLTFLLEDLLFYEGQSSAVTLAPCETIPLTSHIFLHVYVIQLR